MSWGSGDGWGGPTPYVGESGEEVHQAWTDATSWTVPEIHQEPAGATYSAEANDNSDEVEQLEATISAAVESLREAIVVIHRLLPEGAARTDILTGVEGALTVLSES